MSGEVLAGQRIIHMVVQLHLACIVMKAYSMGFAILQHCSRRLVLEGATLMQHPISVALERASLASARGHLEMVARLGRGLVAAQARRLNVSSEWFENRTADEWWLDHAEAPVLALRDVGGVQLAPARKNPTLVERGATGVAEEAAPHLLGLPAGVHPARDGHPAAECDEIVVAQG